MKKTLRFIVSAVVIVFAAALTPVKATPRVNLTPWPQSITVQEGEFTFKPGTTVGIVTGNATAEFAAEVTKFVEAVNEATGLGLKVKNRKPKVAITIVPGKAAEGYGLTVTPKGIKISASTPTGLFYALQSLKKMMPANVMAGKRVDGVAYTVPCVDIEDAPRYPVRGFMLDVSRHFYDVAELKKMLDVMAMYKLNRFHWHLTDDQGWRLPMPKYPNLTQAGAIHQNTLRTDFEQQKQWRDEGAYGPYSYTEDDIREVVAYAKERHIDVMPEVDMPGHMVAAVHAYPEFSCNPDGSWGADYNHEVWNKGGVSVDVLDVSKPEVQQFLKDVIDQLANLFPYEYIHIGGDECPTQAWGKSESCQAFKAEHGLENDTQIQTWITKMIADYANEKYGKKIGIWNEVISNPGADIPMVKSLDNPLVYCWFPPAHAVATADKNQIDFIYTPFNGGYYINRAYAGIDKVGAVKDGSLSTAYNHNPPESDYCKGVQGTFWCEQVDRPTDMEYLALPRLIAVAEQGWTPADAKDYAKFMARLAADTEILKLAGYNYGAHQIVDVEPEP